MVENGLFSMILVLLNSARHLLQTLQKEEGKVHLGLITKMMKKSEVAFENKGISALIGNITL